MISQPKKWRLIKETPYADCKVFKIVKRRYRHPDGREGDFYVKIARDWVQVAALTPDGKIVLVNQFRFGVEKTSWEFPGGVIDEGESPAKAAARELLEETGYAGNRPKLLARIRPNPAILNNTAHIYIIENCKKVSGTHFDPNEEVQTKLYNLDELDSLVKRGKIFHSIAIDALYFLQKYLDSKGHKTCR